MAKETFPYLETSKIESGFEPTANYTPPPIEFRSNSRSNSHFSISEDNTKNPSPQPQTNTLQIPTTNTLQEKHEKNDIQNNLLIDNIPNKEYNITYINFFQPTKFSLSTSNTSNKTRNNIHHENQKHNQHQNQNPQQQHPSNHHPDLISNHHTHTRSPLSPISSHSNASKISKNSKQDENHQLNSDIIKIDTYLNLPDHETSGEEYQIIEVDIETRDTITEEGDVNKKNQSTCINLTSLAKDPSVLTSTHSFKESAITRILDRIRPPD